MITNQLERILECGKIQYAKNQLLAEKTWIKRGPVIPFYVLPKSIQELEYIVQEFTACGAKYKIVGHTSNLYFRNSYQSDAVISTLHLNHYFIEDDYIVCETGVSVERLSRDCILKGILGFEGLIGLPGTVGGAIVNNSSCFKCCLADLIEEAETLVIKNGKVTKERLSRRAFGYNHRSSTIKRHELECVILTVKIRKLITVDIDGVTRAAEENSIKRRETQEGKAHNLGSVFCGVKAKELSISSLGWTNAPKVFAYKMTRKLLYNTEFYKKNVVKWILSMYGYSDLINYVSPKNINCFIWHDDGADEAFDRYCDFMRRYAVYEDMEIEVMS